MMNGFLLVALGGAIGASLRYGAGLAFTQHGGVGGAWATLFVNVVGCAVMGALAAWLANRGEGGNDVLWLLLGVGVLGAFTTFSSFSRDAINLYLDGETLKATAYIGANMIGSLAAFAAGLMAMRRLIG